MTVTSSEASYTLWGFLRTPKDKLPAAGSHLRINYDSVNKTLLDSLPVVKNVIFSHIIDETKLQYNTWTNTDGSLSESRYKRTWGIVGVDKAQCALSAEHKRLYMQSPQCIVQADDYHFYDNITVTVLSSGGAK